MDDGLATSRSYIDRSVFYELFKIKLLHVFRSPDISGLNAALMLSSADIVLSFSDVKYSAKAFIAKSKAAVAEGEVSKTSLVACLSSTLTTMCNFVKLQPCLLRRIDNKQQRGENSTTSSSTRKSLSL